MAGKSGLPRYLRHRDGGYYVRMGVPVELRPYVGRSELHEPLGSNRADALKRHHAIVARFQTELEEARAKQMEGARPAPVPRPHMVRKFAGELYRSQVDHDNAMRVSGAYASGGFDPRTYGRLFEGAYADGLREIISGVASDEKIAALIGWALAEMNHDAAPGSPAWREAARTLAGVQLEVLERRRENDEGRPQ